MQWSTGFNSLVRLSGFVAVVESGRKWLFDWADDQKARLQNRCAGHGDFAVGENPA